MKDISQQDQHPARLDRPTASGIALACAIISLLFGLILAGSPIWVFGFALIFTLLFVLRRELPYALLSFLLCSGYELFVAWQTNSAHSGFTLTDVIFAFSMLAFVAAAMRYVELHPHRFRCPDGRFYPRRLEPSSEEHGSSKAVLRGYSSAVLRMPVAVFLVLGFLLVLPIEVFWPNRYGFDPAVYRTVGVIWLFIVTLIVPASVFSLLKWRNLPARQAGICLRRELAEEIRREQQLVERARGRRQQNVSKRK